MTFPRFLTAGHHRINPIALRGVGRRALVDLEHVGRRSGAVRHTPLRGFRFGDEIVVGLNFGVESDWYKNVRAARSARMRLGADVLDLGAPRLVVIADAAGRMPRWFHWGLRHLVRTRHCVVFPVVDQHPLASVPDWPGWQAHITGP